MRFVNILFGIQSFLKPKYLVLLISKKTNKNSQQNKSWDLTKERASSIQVIT